MARFLLALPLVVAVVFPARLALADGEPLPPLPPPPPPPATPAPAATPAPPAGSAPASSETTQTWDFTLCNGPDTKKSAPVSTECTGVFGLRGSVPHVTGAPAQEGAGMMFAANGEEFWNRNVWSSRGQYGLALGGGGSGLEGEMLGAFALGFRAPVTANQGPVVRAGALGYLLGDDAFASSLIELPQIQVGWQWSRGHAVIELAGTTGVALTGRFRAGDAQARDIGQGFTYGGHASVQVPWVRISLEAERLPTDDALSQPVDVASGTACAVASPIAICVDARAMQSRALLAGAEPQVRAIYAGLTLGFTGEH